MRRCLCHLRPFPVGKVGLDEKEYLLCNGTVLRQGQLLDFVIKSVVNTFYLQVCHELRPLQSFMKLYYKFMKHASRLKNEKTVTEKVWGRNNRMVNEEEDAKAQAVEYCTDESTWESLSATACERDNPTWCGYEFFDVWERMVDDCREGLSEAKLISDPPTDEELGKVGTP